MPSVNALYEEFRGNGLEVRLINFREDAALVRKTVQERGYKAPVLLDASGDVTGRVYGVWGPPTVYSIARGNWSVVWSARAGGIRRRRARSCKLSSKRRHADLRP